MIKSKIDKLLTRLLKENLLKEGVIHSHKDGGINMTKLKEVEDVVVRHTTDGKEVGVKSTQMPRKVEPGVYLYAKVNQAGMAKLQVEHPEVTDTATFEKLIATTFGLPEAGFGSLGNWKTAEQRAEWLVLRNGVAWTPNDPVEVAHPTPTVTTEVVEPATANAVADTSGKDETNIGIILEALKKGMAEGDIQKEANKKFGEVEGKKIMDIAKERLNPPKAVEQKPTPTLNFDAPSPAPVAVQEPQAQAPVAQFTF